MMVPDFSRFPELRTERLLLRDHRPEDADVLYQIRSDERTMAYIGRPRATTRLDAEELIARMKRERSANESLSWVIADATTERMLGSIGLYRLKPEHDTAEVGYQLHPDHWGKGFMTEALEAVTRHTLGPLGFHRIEAITDPRNTRSRRLLEGCGYLLEGITRESYVWEGIRTDSAIYSRLAH
ncbi:MAG: GNAT family N-acetyltransferase [Flavobacteriales bacterium]|nr:GNAT family N-acetyltransferase [Flavobacteriales bacterium]HPJ53041.1 GNAT family N-acetyltransferase [Flavobacteriales bacterium]HRW89181.1 GNAT family N-acetyltransferase [Flavobacteriales bacterium]